MRDNLNFILQSFNLILQFVYFDLILCILINKLFIALNLYINFFLWLYFKIFQTSIIFTLQFLNWFGYLFYPEFLELVLLGFEDGSDLFF